METDRKKVIESAAFLKARIHEVPAVGIVSGTGLGDWAETIEVTARIAYGDIPHFPLSTVSGHYGRLLCGRVAGRPVAVMQGRFHLYEGYTPREVTFPLRVLQALGTRMLILTNAAGGLNPQWAAGDLMVIADHINLTGANPLVGPNDDTWGLRFPDMTAAYDPALIRLATAAGQAHGVRVRSGVYAGLKGPSLETPAEVRFLKTIGADAVGFSTVQEVIAAVHAGMRVLGLSIITNINNPDRPVPATLEDIIAVAREAAPGLNAVISDVLAAGDASGTPGGRG